MWGKIERKAKAKPSDRKRKEGTQGAKNRDRSIREDRSEEGSSPSCRWHCIAN